MRACGVCDVGSIPTEGTEKIKTLKNLFLKKNRSIFVYALPDFLL